ncbi:TetR/AcrR family transcriptional regulator [Puerhibacterium puerhi]|uniref:TetR/AcrR family transcriptional regulator n=1 Tax=Puerhibacterium puerhi TaxID=2692623 RepID=UPI00135A2722|nr:TetR/AcrR family transcriptional regulator [Puerhibacterium puerhi]
MSEQESPGRGRRPGGRSARVREAVLAAVVAELVDGGYASLTFDRVAARAGVHRATLYRRWPSREQLVAEALLAQAGREIPLPDTGSLRGDLRALAHAVAASITSPLGEGVLRTLVSEAGRAPDITVAGRTFWGQRFAAAAELVRRGVERGEVRPDVDPQLVLQMLVAPLFFRLLVAAEPVTAEYADRVLDLLLPLVEDRPGREPAAGAG